MPERILVVDDDAALLKSLGRLIRSFGYEVEAYADPGQAIDRLAAAHFDAVITDYTMPVLTGLDVLRAVNERQPGCPTILLTSYPTVQTAVEAMRIGAFDFVAKPFEVDHLRSVVARAVRRERSPSAAQGIAVEQMILGEAPATQSLRRLITDIADTDSTVLILGPSGTGKELVARALHEGSSRRCRAFIPVHCGAIPEPLLESEMFGHVKGAFTGATQSRPGRFELADGGTLFLDEIGEMPIQLQAKLLRALQERCFEPLGSSRTVRVDVRVVAATNRDLERMISEGKFREDLYWRLNVIPIVVPTLRERKGDVPVLVRHFLRRYRDARGSYVEGFSEAALECLSEYSWPGNVRELENLVERLVILKRRGVIDVADLPERYRGGRVPRPTAAPPVAQEPVLPPEGIDLRAAVAAFEEKLIRQALQRAGGNKNRAAALLGINRTTLVEKLKRMPSLTGQYLDAPSRAVDSDEMSNGQETVGSP